MIRKRAPLFKLVLPRSMPLLPFFCFLIGFGVGVLTSEINQPNVLTSTYPQPQITACFEPYGNCEQLIVKVLFEARESLWIQAFSFTSKPIEDALIHAARRGVSVRVLCDKSQFSTSHSIIHALQAAGIEVTIDPVPGIAHSKIIIVDGKAVFSGSYNFTRAAGVSNTENLLLIQDPSLAQIYQRQWLKRYERASLKNKRANKMENRLANSPTP